ncbi:uncharacterized protein LOC133179728 [Saccostrea echinata]|uniref:uncharacterized protein LOC133179728 n=1 Tax=Saccostrea echinata TaxID=191078 RepID=UPI002A812333|nr:uncharacterized protein LOC133179728 [Saccostrea echinata]XP_061170417.1 uncharacterized protein LOC133179728 [Saccostrea echinata]
MKFRWKLFLTTLAIIYLLVLFSLYTQFHGPLAQLGYDRPKYQTEQLGYDRSPFHTQLVHKVSKIDKKVTFQKLYLQNINISQDSTLKEWSKAETSFCENRFKGFAHLFAILSDVFLDPSFSAGPPGGEEIKNVINQSEEKEFLILKPGYFQIQCKNKNFQYMFPRSDHLAKWISALRPALTFTSLEEDVHNITIAVTRYEYTNIYHTMTDWYNAFLMLLFFNMESLTANILFVDSHPQGGLDSVWTTLFGEFIRAGQLKKPKHFKSLICSIQGYRSPMYDHFLPTLPHIESFKHFFLSKHNIPLTKTLNCDKLSILFIWRRDYVAHPRNPKGLVSRKIKNERDLQQFLQKFYPTHSIASVQTDKLSMQDQLSAIANTDILIGMHGAGLTLALFLPKHGGLIELYPKYWSSDNHHFRAIARWQNLHYRHWQNLDGNNEFPDHYTHIPPSVIQTHVSAIINDMCKSKMKVK